MRSVFLPYAIAGKEMKDMTEHPQDCLDAVASATECTGALPAVPWDADTENARRLLRIHRQPRTVYHRAKG